MECSLPPPPRQASTSCVQQPCKHLLIQEHIVPSCSVWVRNKKLQVDACNLESFHSHEHLWSYCYSLKCTESLVRQIHFLRSYDKDTLRKRVCVCVCVYGCVCCVSSPAWLFRGQESTFLGQETWLMIKKKTLVRQLMFRFWNFSFIPKDVDVDPTQGDVWGVNRHLGSLSNNATDQLRWGK